MSYPYVFLNAPGQQLKLFRENRAAYRGSSYCLLCSSVARGGKDSTAETLSHSCFPVQCLISSCLRLRSPQACTHQAGYSREPVLQFSMNPVTRIADSISCSLREAAKGQCPSPKGGSSWTIRAQNNYMPMKYLT